MRLEPDADEALNLVTVFTGDGATGEMQAEEIHALLDAEGIYAVIVGSQALPNLPFEVRVAGERAEEARQIIAAAAEGVEKALAEEFPE